MGPHISERSPEPANVGCPELIVIWRGCEFRLSANSASRLSIGMGRDCDLIVPGPYASREHASLHLHRNQFQLTDHSTNGTYVQLEDERITHVHRTSVKLWGSGFLAFGEPLSLESAVKFSHA